MFLLFWPEGRSTLVSSVAIETSPFLLAFLGEFLLRIILGRNIESPDIGHQHH